MAAAKLLTLAEVAERLGLGHQRVHQLVQAGRLKASRFGKSWMVTEPDLARFQAQPRPTGRPPAPEKKEPKTAPKA